MKEAYRLFIDDVREPPDGTWTVARSSDEALKLVEDKGMPKIISFDHDLGGDDTSMAFLKKLVDTIWDGKEKPPEYKVHSANPIGSLNIVSFMESWRKSINMG